MPINIFNDYTVNMRLPFTKFGLPQVVVYPLIVLALMLFFFIFLKPKPVLIPTEIALFLVFLWMLSFFRDPVRNIKQDELTLFSPADGTVTDISYVDNSVLGGGAVRIGIFLSIFNVHINRAPCSVSIESVVYKKGKFKNALSGESGLINESNDIVMQRLNEPKEKLIVRQISGAIARHIVCEAGENAEYHQGEQFGMIKFGSRTELYFPAADNFKVTVEVGSKVQAGLSPLVRIKP